MHPPQARAPGYKRNISFSQGPKMCKVLSIGEIPRTSASSQIHPEGCIWLEADVRGIYPTYLIVEEVSKTIEIINSRDVSVYILEFNNFNYFLGIYGIYIPQKNKRNRLNFIV